MSNGNSMDQVLAEAAEKIRREAYQAGWRDAVTALTKAAAEAAQLEAGELASGNDLSQRKPPPAQSGLTQGSTPWYVWQAVYKKPGMTGSEIVSVVQDNGHRVSEGNIRTSIGRVRDKKLIVSRHNKWFPV